LVKEGDNLISLFKLGDFRARFKDFARAVGGEDNRDVKGEGVFPCIRIVISLLLKRMKVEDNLWDDQVLVV
jgi:hypothetical protein